MDKTERLLERIAAGWYDDKLMTLLKNAETNVNYPVWKACTLRREVAGAGAKLIMPSRALLELALPKGISCEVCAPSLRTRVVELAEVLERCGSYNMDVGYMPTHIRAITYQGLDAIKTKVGQSSHRIELLAVWEDGSVFYLVNSVLPKTGTRREVFTDPSKSKEWFLSEVQDEHLI